MRRWPHIVALLAAALPLPAFAAIGYTLLVNADGTRHTAWRNGDRPIAGGSCPTGYTCDNKGDGGGQIDEVSSTEFDFSTFGSNPRGNYGYAYKDAGSGEVQLVGQCEAGLATGGLTGQTALVLGLTEATADASFYHQCGCFINAPGLRSSTGTPSVNVNTNGSASEVIPRWGGMTYDPVAGVSKCFESSDGTNWTEVNSVTRTYSDVIAYLGLSSGSASATAQGEISNIALTTEITLYDEGGGPTPVGTPANFTAEAISTSRIDLEWTAGSGPAPTDYDLEFSTTSSNGPWTDIPITTATSYSHTGRTANTEHFYQLNATDGVTTSARTATSATTLPSGGGGAIDFHAGHYLSTSATVNEAEIDNVCAAVNARSYIKGMVMRVYWAVLEPSMNTYDFDLVEYARACLDAGKYLFLQIQSTIFQIPGLDAGQVANRKDQLIPAYLQAASPYGGGATYQDPKMLTRLWDADVIDRRIALTNAIGAAYNGVADFEGLITGETALFIPNGTDGYSPGAFATQLKRMMPASRLALPNKALIIFANYISGGGASEFPDLIAQAAASDWIVGGPDSEYKTADGGGTAGRKCVRGVDDNGSGCTIDWRGTVGSQIGDQNKGLTNAGYIESETFDWALLQGMRYGIWVYIPGAVNFPQIMNYIDVTSPDVITTCPGGYPSCDTSP